jgi:hypothetical protein
LKLHNENEINCKLLLSNLNKSVYKTIDDLISQIEYENDFEIVLNGEEDNKMKFFKTFGLVKKQNNNNDKNKLLLKLRENLIDINWQFIKDLDKWKLSHIGSSSNLHSTQQHIISIIQQPVKISLKPNANLNRPLLIRSKKVKRIRSFGSAFSSIYYYITRCRNYNRFQQLIQILLKILS